MKVENKQFFASDLRKKGFSSPTIDLVTKPPVKGETRRIRQARNLAILLISEGAGHGVVEHFIKPAMIVSIKKAVNCK
jgi:hypothetical protein